MFARTKDLIEGQVACRWCGVSVPRPNKPFTRIHATKTPAGQVREHLHEYGQCAECGRFETFSDPRDAHVAAALTALGLASVPVDSHLRWAFISSSDAPPLAAWHFNDTRGQCASRPWSHVDRKPFRAAYAAALAEQATTPKSVMLEAPDGRPCAACGIATVEVNGLRWGRDLILMEDVWRRINVQAKRRGPDRATTYLCRECITDFMDAGRAFGPTFFETSCLRAHGRKLLVGEQWPGIRPWLWLNRERANPSRWSHVRLVDPQPEPADADRIAQLEAQVAALTKAANGG